MSSAQSPSAVQAAEQQVSYRKQIQQILREQDAVSILGSRGKLLGGLASCVCIAAIAATVIAVLLEVAFDRVLMGWFVWFVLCLVAMAGLIIRHDRGTSTGAVVSPLTADAELEVARPEHAASRLRGMIGWPVRAVVDGLAAVRGRWKAHQMQHFRRCAQLVLDLARFDGGVQIKTVMHPPEDIAVFSDALEWLDRHQWVGRSSDGGKLWLSTEGRNRLEARQLIPPKSVTIVR